MNNLKSLYAPYSNVQDISMLADKTNLEYLQLHHNNISDITSLKELTKLKYLNLSLNNISNIDNLEELPNLENANINNNPIPEEKIVTFYAPKEQDFFTRKLPQRLGDTDYTFVLSAFKSKRSGKYQTTEITIKNAVRGTTIQEIIPSDYAYLNDDPSSYNDNLGFYIEDMNFDGYADIRIIKFLPAGPNVPSICWVWDKSIEQYVYHPELSAITSPEVDYENGLIYTFGRSSSSEHFEKYYRYIYGAPTLIKEARTGSFDENDLGQAYSITHELVDGQWITTEKKKIEIRG